MIISGDVIEVGDLDGEGSERGFVIYREDGSFVTVKGLTEHEASTVAALLFETVELVLKEAPAGAPP